MSNMRLRSSRGSIAICVALGGLSGVAISRVVEGLAPAIGLTLVAAVVGALVVTVGEFYVRRAAARRRGEN